MGLIKSTDAPHGIQPFSMKDIEKQARALLLRARQQAEQFLAAAQTEAEDLKKQAQTAGQAQGYIQGVAQGREEGIKAGRDQALAEHKAQLTTVITTLTQSITAINTSRRDLEAAALKDVLELAISISERVTKRHGVLDPSVAVANLAEALKLVAHASDLRIAIHPTQKTTLLEALPKLKMQWPSLEHVELLDDPTLSPGGCRIYTTHGMIDADLDGQLNRVVADLLPERQEAIA